MFKYIIKEYYYLIEPLSASQRLITTSYQTTQHIVPNKRTQMGSHRIQYTTGQRINPKTQRYLVTYNAGMTR